jgi:hypothetical protein
MTKITQMTFLKSLNDLLRLHDITQGHIQRACGVPVAPVTCLWCLWCACVSACGFSGITFSDHILIVLTAYHPLKVL